MVTGNQFSLELMTNAGGAIATDAQALLHSIAIAEQYCTY
jgi:hypothetical protein